MNPIIRRPATLVLFLPAFVLIAACSSAAVPSQAPVLLPPSAAASALPSDELTPVPGASASAPASDADRAAAAVLATDPLFANLQPSNPDLIGQCCFYEVKPTRVAGR